MEFGIELLCKTSLIRGHRRGKKERPAQLIPEQELFEAYDEITRAVYRTALQKKWLEQIENLLKEYRRLGQDVLLEMAEQFDAAQFSSTELQPMQYWLRTELCDSKEYGWTEWIEVLKTWIRCTESSDPVGKFGWIFLEWHCLPMEELLDNQEEKNWKREEEERERIRAEKFAALKIEFGMDAVLRLLETMRNQHAWGVFLAKNTTCEEFAKVAEAIRKQEKQQLLAGFFDQGDFQEASAVFEKMSENEKLRLLSTLQREEIDSWLTTREREQTYWANQDMRWSYNERRYKKLLQYHPGGILLYLYGNSGQVEHLFELFRRVFDAIAEQRVNA